VDFLVNGERSSDPNTKRPRERDPSTLEGGSLNALGYAGLSGALDFLATRGVGSIFAQVQALQDRMEPALEGMGVSSLRAPSTANRSAILSFELPEGVSAVELHSRLAHNGVQAGIPRGCLRFGFHHANSLCDVDRVVELLPELLAECRIARGGPVS
jgi:selenocysteine lyase/cysteine desulfurase